MKFREIIERIHCGTVGTLGRCPGGVRVAADHVMFFLKSWVLEESFPLKCAKKKKLQRLVAEASKITPNSSGNPWDIDQKSMDNPHKIGRNPVGNPEKSGKK